ncbi:MAG: ribosome biogenesis GTPase Der [Patescibacteria group bacterium]
MSYNVKNNLPLVVIFGRTNVGKSTLFNCLIEKKQALVSKIEGTTRDSNIGQIEWRGVKFELVDTGGIIDLKHLENKKIKAQDIEAKVQQQARDYLKRADLILFLVDTKIGLMPQDKQMALFLKKAIRQNKILLLANKADSPKLRSSIAEFNKLNLNEPIPISAANGSGTGDMLDIVVDKIKRKSKNQIDNQPDELKIDNSIKVCILGKPNVGKSSLLNSILGYNRVIVSETPHTTREPQNTNIIYKDNKVTLIDTAGISKKGTKTKGLEKYGIGKSLSALKKSAIALLVIDISQTITHQDQKLIEEIIERRASFIIIANKWDLIPEKNTKKYTQYIYGQFPFATWAPIHFASALTGSKVDKILNLILEISEQRKIKLGDSQLNKFLVKIVKMHPPTKGKGTKHPRIYEFKQIHENPPKFKIRIGPNDNLHSSYVHFIKNRLRDKYGFIATPIKMIVTKK